MMLQLRILHKGLILVAVPLIAGVGFISLLYYGLSVANQHIEHEFMLKDAMIDQITTTRCGIFSVALTNMCNMTHDERWRKDAIANNRLSVLAYARLQKKLENEHSLKVPEIWVLVGDLFKGRQKSQDANSFIRKLKRVTDHETRAAVQAMDQLQVFLYCGLASTIFVSVAMSIFLCMDIKNRLLVILNNTVSISKGTSLSPPLKGSDEIAELDQLLFKSATEIRELERFKKEMIGIVSHELKSPLSSVGGFLSSLSSGVFGELTARAKDKADRTYNSVKRLMGLVSELLYLDKLELEMNPEEIRVDELLAASVDAVKELSEKSGIEIQVKGCDGVITADRNRLIQVIVNLLSNALKFSPPEGKILLETALKEGSFECRIVDEGAGIPESYRQQIFEPFKQVDATDALSKKGTGLGLTISKSIVEQHGGEIGVESEPGKGSTFWFRIPRSANARPEVSKTGLKTVQQDTLSGAGKFSVLKQLLLIISVPLIFQISFACVIGWAVNVLRDQIHQEKISKEIIASANHVQELFAFTSRYGFLYAYSHNSNVLKSYQKGRDKMLDLLNHAEALCAKRAIDPVQIDRIKDVRDRLEKVSILFDSEATKSAALSDLLPGVEHEARKALTSTIEKFGPEPSANDVEKLNDLADNYNYDSVGLSHLEFLNKLMVPINEVHASEDRLLVREETISDDLSKKRVNTIKQMEVLLCSGIVLNILLSVFVALFLLRGLTNRLRHVMNNTDRLTKREVLQPPPVVCDEITYVDLVLCQTAQRLMELETFKRELIAIVSHELRTPLLSISSALELFASEVLGELSEKGKNRLNYAQAEADRLIRLINDLLDIEKMEAGKFVLDMAELNVAEPIDNCVSAVTQLADAKQIKLVSHISAGEHEDAKLWADRDRLCQVIINLLSNAIKYSPESGTVNVAVEKSGNEMKFSVEDQGRGIPDELKEKIFDRFIQVEKSDETVRGGTGLGLAIARAIIEQHGGTIGVDSKLGSGSTFWFKVPIHKSDSAISIQSSAG